MQNNNLLASAALFSELYNNDSYTSVTDIIAEFIKAVLVSKNKLETNPEELKELLHEYYGFDFLPAVIKTTVNSKFKELVERKDGKYLFNSKISEGFERINDEYNSISEIQKKIIDNLLAFVEDIQGNTLNAEEKDQLFDNLNKYLLDNGINDRYSTHISAYIISNDHDEEFRKNLNLIREGLILYQGIRYTADLNELGKWTSNLTVFLSTEHLFNALGYNGTIFEEIFNDFYSLTNDVNRAQKDGTRMIELKYFQETKDEVDAFFQTAEAILKKRAALDPSKTAMRKILEGAKYPSDIVAKKAKFFNDLSLKGIALQEFNKTPDQYARYNLEDESVLEKIRKQTEDTGREFDEFQCRELLRTFTKINYYRRGVSDVNFEKVGFVLVTNNRFALMMAHNLEVKFNGNDIAFAKDLDYITSKLWFKLKKGFSNKSGLPKSFDVITKAQLVISSKINHSISEQYETLLARFREGALSEAEARDISYDLRERTTKPEEISSETLDLSLHFLSNEDYYEEFLKEREKKKGEQAELQKEVNKLTAELAEKGKRQQAEMEANALKLRDLNSEIFANAKWDEERNNMKKDFWYAFKVFIVTSVMIVFGIVSKESTSIKKLEWGFYILAVVIPLWELFGRSYIFNKSRVLQGFNYFKLLLNPKEFKAVEMKFKEATKSEYREVQV